MSFKNKTYFARVYKGTPSGTAYGDFVGVVYDIEWTGFSWQINGGLGSSKVKFPLSTADFGEDEEIGLYYQFEIYVIDKESSKFGQKVYSGYLVEYATVDNGHQEYIEGELWGYATEFPVKMLEDGDLTTLAYNSEDPSDILLDVMSKYDGKVSSNIDPEISEDFSTDQYKDTANTTANWDTVTNKAKLNAETLTESFETTSKKDSTNTTANWDTVNGKLKLPIDSLLVDSYSETNVNVDRSLYSGSTIKLGQSFLNTVTEINSVKFFLKKSGSPTGDMVAKLYAHTGTYGTTSMPTGSALGTSERISISNLTTSYQLIEFTFSTPVDVSVGTYYVITIEYSGGDNQNVLYVGVKNHYETPNEPHDGNASFLAISWHPSSDRDLCFYVYGTGYGTSNNIGQSLKLNTINKPFNKIRLTKSDTTPTGTSIDYQISGNGGTNWQTITPDTIETVTNLGNDVRFKITLNGTSTLTPEVDSIALEVFDENNNIIQSLGYDSTITEPTYESYTQIAILTGSSAISYLFSDSEDNSTWGAWVSDITLLTRRYFRFKATLTGTIDESPILDGIDFSISGGSISITGNTVSYTFKQNTIQEAIEQVVKMSPPYWYWRVGADNRIVFDVKNLDIINHRLDLSKHLTTAKFTRSAKTLKNACYFLGGSSLYLKSLRTNSINQYGKRVERKQDERVTVQSSGEIITGTFLDINDHPAIIGEITVVDSNGDDRGGYDIESLKVGQIVQIDDIRQDPNVSEWDVMNWDEDYWDFPLSSAFGVPFQIISIDYTLDSARLTLAYFQADGAKRLEDMRRNLDNFRTLESPDTPTNI